MGKGGFEELMVWQKSKELAVEIYKLTAMSSFAKDFALRDQMRRAAVSFPSNIAEGDERDTDKDAIRHFCIAKGSAAELLTQLIIAVETGNISEEHFGAVEKSCRTIMRMLASLIKSRTTTPRAQCLEPSAEVYLCAES
jgi:four helix bundle protein